MIIRSDRDKIESEIERIEMEIQKKSEIFRGEMKLQSLTLAHQTLGEILVLKGQRDALRDIAFTDKYKGRCENCQE